MVNFLVIGSVNVIAYNDIFSLIKKGDVNFGWNKVVEFDGTDMKFGNIRWFSNISDYCPPLLVLSKKYVEGNYKKFDNFDAINIDKSKDIPYDYDGVMGVPFVFWEKLNKNQFDIIGMLTDNHEDNVNVFNGEKRYINEGHKYFTGPVIDGRALYKRLLIRNK